MNAQGTRQARAKYAQMCAFTPTISCVHSSTIDVSTAPMGCECVHFIAKDRHKATELGLTWHASFIGTSIEIYLAPGWSGQGV